MVVAVSDQSYPLWMKAVCSNYRIDHRTNLFQHYVSGGDGLWGQISNFLAGCNVVLEIAKRCMRKKIGNGVATLFWLDHWLGDECLKDRFPRLFSISIQKHCFISEMGCWIDNVWQ